MLQGFEPLSCFLDCVLDGSSSFAFEDDGVEFFACFTFFDGDCTVWVGDFEGTVFVCPVC